MSSKPPASLEGLQAMLAQALQAYELAKTTYLQETALAEAEQGRAAELLAETRGVERRAHDLLTKAGLAHIAGAPLQLGGPPAANRRSDEAVTAAFVGAQTAGVELRTALARLVAAQLDAGQWDAARRTLQPLLADKAAPLYSHAFDLLCQSTYRPGAQALAKGEWQIAREQLAATLAQQADYRDAGALLRAAYLRPAQGALDAKRWEETRQHAEPWLKQHKEDGEARALICESTYRPGAAALAKGEWLIAREQLAATLAQQADYRDAGALLRAAYLRPAQQALEAGQWEDVRQHVGPWFETHSNDGEARALLYSSHYSEACQLAESQNWAPVWLILKIMQKLNPAFREVALFEERIRKEWHVEFDWVTIPAGEFLYGPDKKRMSLDAFRITRTPITNSQYFVYVALTGASAPSHWAAGQIPAGKEDHPVVNVNWDDVQAYCKWAMVQVPSEKQWEKAARGTDGGTYPWGEQQPGATYCNFNKQAGGTTPVGNYPTGASPYGLLDMAGNVSEWCKDYEYPKDVMGNISSYAQKTYVLRGGSYYSSAQYVQCASREWNYPNSQSDHIGFRVASPGL